MRKFFGAFCFATLAAVAAPALAATDYPNDTVKMIVPFPPGGPTDGMARLIAKYLGEHLDTPAIVENKGGDGGNTGSQYVRSEGQTSELYSRFDLVCRLLHEKI